MPSDAQSDEDAGPREGVSRRKLLGAGAAAGGALGVLSASAARAQRPSGGDPNAGRPFRGFVTYPGMDGETVDLRLLPLGPRDVLVRSDASITTYTMSRTAFREPAVGTPLGPAGPSRHVVPGQGCVGVVEQIGPMVKRFKVGDRAVLCGNPQCGQCYQCLSGRAEWCQVLSEEVRPFAAMRDGTQVYPSGGVGGLSGLVVATEEWGMPLWTDLPAVEVAMANSTGAYGLGAAFNQAPITPGADALIIGCGPVGLGAVQGARIRGAGQIIAVEPIAARRELARKFGATTVFDPNAMSSDKLIETIREMCKGPTDRIFSGGRSWTNTVNVPKGADFTIEAVGGEMHVPKNERGPDPTGILPLRQAWEATRAGGHVSLMGGFQLGEVSFPGFGFANRGRTVHSVQTGLQVMRDVPRIIKLVERGHFDVKSMCTSTFPVDRAIESLHAVADRTTIGSFLTFG
jgi:S-(hydroxymethyl)glutathione dehydrogenase/alcohol dehydrogenase